MSLRPWVVALVVSCVLLGSSADASSGPGKLQAHGSAYGRVLFDGRGFALYAFTADSRTASRCRGKCAVAWPPFLTKGRPVALSGVSRTLLGQIRRPDGASQVTYAGHPLYYYVGDRSAGQILCQDVVEFGGRWLVVAATGKLVR